MPAVENTLQQIEFFKSIGIESVDIRAIILHDATDKTKGRKNVQINKLENYTKWLYHLNANEHRDINIRPSPDVSHACVFLDDVPPRHAARLARRARTLLVHTSEAGGYQTWVQTDHALTIDQRGTLQKELCIEYHADAESTYGGHFGRLAGYKNIKRGGNWINCKTPSTASPLTVSAPAPAITLPTKTTCGASEFDDFDALHAALDCICSDDYGTWLKVGIALHSIDAKEIWDAWSAKSEKFDAAMQDKKWPTLAGRVTVRSIFWLAKQA